MQTDNNLIQKIMTKFTLVLVELSVCSLNTVGRLLDLRTSTVSTIGGAYVFFNYWVEYIMLRVNHRSPLNNNLIHSGC